MGAAFSFAKGVTANFTFGTGKFGDLAGFTSAIVLAMISILIGYESVTRTHGHGQHSISTLQAISSWKFSRRECRRGFACARLLGRRLPPKRRSSSRRAPMVRNRYLPWSLTVIFWSRRRYLLEIQQS